eukprot:10598024-Lingulodinium_polyedra.AAC.1
MTWYQGSCRHVDHRVAPINQPISQTSGMDGVVCSHLRCSRRAAWPGLRALWVSARCSSTGPQGLRGVAAQCSSDTASDMWFSTQPGSSTAPA